ncbi:hypothetical protein PPERSA_06798 [Pseudocohnilembus persalinus]|uniref:Uncharacterized protein n=1 Tax=Pseudocohnilembus persalinus TaxID=266149 RepID=A0A0V0QSD0_PSEPJ|nr:hypothetical protein PPERSA_06798 [Pseudocohnilembus persalinus]|eukprot:KRX05164.1 hypothetical protein PPERSA_06798 [Pseudocohnilembus persalinus]
MFKMINQINHYTNTKKFGVNIGNFDVIESFNNQYPNLQNQKEDQEEEQESVYNILKFNFSKNNFYYKDLNTKLLQRKSLKKRLSLQQIQQQQKLKQNQEKQDQDQNDDKDILDQIDLPFSLDKIDEKFQQKINFIEANSKLNIFFFNEIQYDFQFCNVQQLLFFNLLESKCEKLTINVSYNPQILFNTRLEQNRNQLELANLSNNNPSSIQNIQPNTQIVDQIPTLKDQINIQIHQEDEEENNDDDSDQINQKDGNYKNEQKINLRNNKDNQNDQKIEKVNPDYQKNNIQDYKGSISPQENIKVDETEDYEKQESNRVLLKKFETKLELVKNQTSNTSINYQQQIQEDVSDQENKNQAKKEEQQQQQAIQNNKVSQNQLRKKKRKIQTTLTKDKNYLELNSYVNYENIQQDLFIFGELDKLCTLFDDQQSKSINSLQLNLLKVNTNTNIQQTLKHSPSAQNGSGTNFTVCDLQTQLQFTSQLYFKELRITMQHNYLDNKGLSKFFGLLSKNSSLNTLYMDISLNDITDNIFYLMLKNEIIDQTIPSVEYLEINISNNSLSDLILGFYSFYYLILNLFNKLKTLKINVSNNPKMNCILKEIMKAQEINANYLSPKNRKQFFSSLKSQQISSYLCYQRENMTQLENLSIDFSGCNIGNPAYQGEQNEQNLKIFHDKNIILDQNSLKIKHIKDQKYMVGRQINNFKNVKKQQKNMVKNKQIDICLPINDNLVAQKHFQIFYYNHCVFVKPLQNKPVYHLLENKNLYSIFNFYKFYIGNPQDKRSIEIQISCLPQNYNQQVIRDELLTVATSKNTKLKNIQNKYQHLIPIDDYLAEYLESYNLTLSNKLPQQMQQITENTMKLSKTSIITNNQKNTVSEIDTFSELPKENQLTTYQQLQSPQSHALLSPQQQTTQQLLPKLDSDNQIQQHLSDQEHIEYLKKKNLSDLNGQVKNLMKKKRKFSQQAPPLKNFCENNKIQNNIKISNKQSLQFLKQPNSNIFLQKNFPYLFAPNKEQPSENNSQNQKLQQPYNEHLTTTVDSKQKPAQQQQQKDLKYFVTNNQKKNSSLSSFNSNFQNPMSTNKEVLENYQDRPIKKYLLQKNSNSQNELYIHYRSEQDELGHQEHKSLNYYEDFEQEVTISVKLQNVTQIHKFKLEKGQYFTIGTSPSANDILISKNHKIFKDIKLNNQGDFNLCQIGRSPEGIWYISKKQNIENLDLFYQYGDNENNDIIKQQQKKNNQDIYQIKKESRILIGNNLLTVNNISINKTQSKK